MTEFDAAEGRPVPALFVAVTVKVYAVPLASPVTVIGDAGPVAVTPPGDEVTVYEVIGEPPIDTGAVKVTMACALPPVAVPITGGPAVAAAVTEFEGTEAEPVPAALVAVTVKV